MTLVFACESRFLKCKGVYYADSQSFADSLWERYLGVFDAVIVFARVKEVGKQSNVEKYFQITDPKVSFIDVPSFVGPKEYLSKRKEVINIANQTATPKLAYICRIPGKMGEVLSNALQKKRIPYAVEVVGDPWDVFAPGAIKHPLAPFFRIVGRVALGKIVKGAKAALYVTKQQLQKRYPAEKGCYSTFASNVILRQEHLVFPREFSFDGNVKLLAVGSLAQMYKSPDVAIETVAELKNRGISATLTWLGDGVFREDMGNLASKLGVSDCVFFFGNVSCERVREELSKCDIFLHISRTEGLPRAVVEAMGAGLPCIGSRVGGIPELLASDALVSEIKPVVVADKIEQFINSPELAEIQAKRNYEESKMYLENILKQRRVDFYNEVIRMSK